MEEQYVIRLAGISDVEGINKLYNKSYKSNRTQEKFDWEFNSAPAGKSIYVIAEFKNEIVGTQCVIPYHIITIENETVLSGKSEDTLVSSDHRGKQIFEKMYALLIEECKKAGIQFIWGFTYATKPFVKLNFIVPFKVSMGLMSLKPNTSANYFSSLSPANTAGDKIKIRLLTVSSWVKTCILSGSGNTNFNFERQSFNNNSFNYLSYQNSFGLKLDDNFLNYRTESNAYNSQYVSINYKDQGKNLISMVYTITKQGVGFIIHLYIDKLVSQKQMTSFLAGCVKKTELKSCHTLRFWGMTHNFQNAREVEMLGRAGFIFIKRGISFVWLDLQKTPRFKPENFVLSRMASQGTD